jgi:hypothetical protein
MDKLACRSWMSIALLCGIGLSDFAGARNIHVCATCAHTSIQSAVNDAASGDVVYVAAGLYTENVTIEGKQLTLIGAGASTTGVPGLIHPSAGVSEVIAAGEGPVFTLGTSTFSFERPLITIQGFTIMNGHHLRGTGIGGGVQVRAGAYLHLLDSIVTQNTAASGGGIGVDSPGGAGAFETTIIGCLIDDNTATTSISSYAPGGGIAVLESSYVSIQHSIVTRNQSTSGGGVSSAVGSTLTMADTTVSNNTAAIVHTPYGPIEGAGGGLQISGDFAISGSFFVDNTAYGEDGGGGIEIYFTAWRNHTISSTIIARNSVPFAGAGGGIAAYATGDSSMKLILNQVYVVENLGGGGLWSTVPLTLTDTTVKDNIGGDVCRNGIC